MSDNKERLDTHPFQIDGQDIWLEMWWDGSYYYYKDYPEFLLEFDKRLQTVRCDNIGGLRQMLNIVINNYHKSKEKNMGEKKLFKISVTGCEDFYVACDDLVTAINAAAIYIKANYDAEEVQIKLVSHKALVE